MPAAKSTEDLLPNMDRTSGNDNQVWIDIGIIVGDTREEVMAAVGDGSQFGATVTYLAQELPLGLAHCVLIARDFLGDDIRHDDRLERVSFDGWRERREIEKKRHGVFSSFRDARVNNSRIATLQKKFQLMAD